MQHSILSLGMIVRIVFMALESISKKMFKNETHDCQAEAQIKESFKFFWMTRMLKCQAEPVEAFSKQVPFDRLRVTSKSDLSLAASRSHLLAEVPFDGLRVTAKLTLKNEFKQLLR